MTHDLSMNRGCSSTDLGRAYGQGCDIVIVAQEEVLMVYGGALVDDSYSRREVHDFVLGGVEEVLGAVVLACK